MRILVVGDAMLDKYIEGSVNRISPEAPIPILLQEEISYHPGGAANLAVNLRNLELDVDLIAVSGRDEESKILERLCEEKKIKSFFYNTSHGTITKTRIVCNNQQMLRVDREATPEQYNVVSKIPKRISISNYQMVIISDYGKGFCNDLLIKDVIDKARKFDVPVLIDPKGQSWDKYKGAYLIKPNLAELYDFLGGKFDINSELIRTLQDTIKNLDIQNLIISRSREGLVHVHAGETSYYPAPKVEVYDVSGAGDTVMAIIAYGILKGYSLDKTLSLAVRCGSFVVTKAKTYAIKKVDLKNIRI